MISNRKIITLLGALCIIMSCETSPYKRIGFGAFDIEVPSDWKKYKIRGIDSYVGGIITSSKDTLIFDLGFYSPDVSKNSFPMVYDSVRLAELTKKERGLLSNTKHLIVDSLTGTVNYKDYKKYKVYYDSVDCFEAKFIEPKNKGFGASGIYIDDLKVDGINKTRFSFYGNHLVDSVQREFKKALKSIRFKEYCPTDN